MPACAKRGYGYTDGDKEREESRLFPHTEKGERGCRDAFLVHGVENGRLARDEWRKRRKCTLEDGEMGDGKSHYRVKLCYFL